jgi:hypothetical protein
VRVRPIGAPTSAWEKIGILRVNNNGEGNATFKLQANALRDASQLEVCLKSIGNFGVFCVVTAATTYTDSSSDLSYLDNLDIGSLTLDFNNAINWQLYEANHSRAEIRFHNRL